MKPKEIVVQISKGFRPYGCQSVQVWVYSTDQKWVLNGKTDDLGRVFVGVPSVKQVFVFIRAGMSYAAVDASGIDPLPVYPARLTRSNEAAMAYALCLKVFYE